MVYTDCINSQSGVYGKACERTCELQEPPCLGIRCYPGCVCPKDLVRTRNDTCVQPHFCPCQHNGITYAPGDSIQVDCNQCNCSNGFWNCTKNYCAAICKTFGNGHYATFDGKGFLFNGYSCEYVVAQDYCGTSPQNGTFQITVENILCGSTLSTCSKSIRFFLQDQEITLADGTYSFSPRSKSISSTHRFRVYSVGLYLIVDASNGIKLVWDRKTTLFIKVTPDRKNELCGLCGKYNGDVSDDFTMRDHSVSANALQFGNSWKVDETCPDMGEEVPPCVLNFNRKASAERECSLLSSGVFASCHGEVDYVPYYEACVRDSCACNTGLACELFCTVVAAYAEACNEVGLCIHWRTPDLCPVFCDFYNDPNACTWHYHPCGTVNTKTCDDPEGINLGDFPRLEGCYPKCSNATYLDERTLHCVSRENCSCELNDTIVLPGGTLVSRDTCQICNCTMGQLHCATANVCCVYNGHQFKPGEIVYIHTDLGSLCNVTGICTDAGMIGRDTLCPSTTPTITATSPAFTTGSGCYSLVPPRQHMETWKVNNCTNATCVGNNVTYTVKTCSESTKPNCSFVRNVSDSDGCCTWQCQCKCQGWGDPHYITFDGVQYTFLEDCTYILMEERIKQQNLTILLDNYQFTRGNPASFVRGLVVNYNGNSVNMSIPATLGRRQNIITVYFNNILVMPPLSSNGIDITSSRIVVKVAIPAIDATISFTGDMFSIYLPYDLFKNNTQGQCGVCNNLSNDDCAWWNGTAEPASCCPSTASSWAVRDVTKPHCLSSAFNSSKNQSCTPSTTPAPCQMNMSVCGAINSTMFLNCSKVVSLQEFLVTCKYDLCQVNSSQAGCPSIQAAAEKCAQLGYNVDWRSATNGTCGYNCTNGQYMPQGPKIVKSCSNGSVVSTIQHEEGCYCPEGKISCNGSCIPEISTTTMPSTSLATTATTTRRTTPPTSTATTTRRTTPPTSTATTTRRTTPPTSTATTTRRTTPPTSTATTTRRTTPPTSATTTRRTTPPTSATTTRRTTPPTSTATTTRRTTPPTSTATTTRRTTPPTSTATTTRRTTPPTSATTTRRTTPPTSATTTRRTTPPTSATTTRRTTPPTSTATTTRRTTPPTSATTTRRTTPPTTRRTTPPTSATTTRRTTPPTSATTTRRTTPPTSATTTRRTTPTSTATTTRRTRPTSTATTTRRTTRPTSTTPITETTTPPTSTTPITETTTPPTSTTPITETTTPRTSTTPITETTTPPTSSTPITETATPPISTTPITETATPPTSTTPITETTTPPTSSTPITETATPPTSTTPITETTTPPTSSTPITETTTPPTSTTPITETATPPTSTTPITETTTPPTSSTPITETTTPRTSTTPITETATPPTSTTPITETTTPPTSSTPITETTTPPTSTTPTTETTTPPTSTTPTTETTTPPTSTTPTTETTTPPTSTTPTTETTTPPTSTTPTTETTTPPTSTTPITETATPPTSTTPTTETTTPPTSTTPTTETTTPPTSTTPTTETTTPPTSTTPITETTTPRTSTTPTTETATPRIPCTCEFGGKIVNAGDLVYISSGNSGLCSYVRCSPTCTLVTSLELCPTTTQPTMSSPPSTYQSTSPQSGCYYNGHYYNIDTNWTKPGDNCTHFTCKSVLGQASIVEMKISCSPAINISSCQPGTVIKDEYGCCSSCPLQQSPCRLFEGSAEINLPGCQPKNISLPFCQGNCSSTTRLDVPSMAPVYTCNCCHDLESEGIRLSLTCTGGSQYYDYIYIKSCRCTSCS
uniref:Mucin-2-like n=1 Tax=Petromyzon marinus TaxID=7757 RepID=A0AAJ7WPD1_PETMA|nr:mucin-2-like [Petromyzon marinus]